MNVALSISDLITIRWVSEERSNGQEQTELLCVSDNWIRLYVSWLGGSHSGCSRPFSKTKATGEGV